MLDPVQGNVKRTMLESFPSRSLNAETQALRLLSPAKGAEDQKNMFPAIATATKAFW